MINVCASESKVLRAELLHFVHKNKSFLYFRGAKSPTKCKTMLKLQCKLKMATIKGLHDKHNKLHLE